MLFTTTFVLFFILNFGVRHWLAQRQIRHVAAHRETVPAEFAQQVTLDEHQKAADYTIAKLKLGLLENAFSAVVLISFTLLGGLEYLNQALTDLMGNGIAQQMALLCSIFLISGILDLPFTWQAVWD